MQYLNYFDQHAKNINDFFDVQFCGKKVKYKIMPNKVEFDKEFWLTFDKNQYKSIPDYCVGFKHKDCIIMLSFNSYKNIESHKDDTFDYYKKTVIHEFVHYVINLFTKQQKCEHPEKYLTEGLACYLSEQMKGKDIKLTCTLDDLMCGKQVKYGNYYLLIKYLFENYDKDFIFELIKDKKRQESF